MKTNLDIPRHPAKYTNSFFEVFVTWLKDTKNVLDPFGGTGKIGRLKEYGYCGEIYANEIEREWLEPNLYQCDKLSFQDAEFLNYPNGFFDAICTSPTYGNRMADHHIAKDNSKRNTYTHCLGHQLQDGNTGKMQWGEEYRAKHVRIYKHLAKLLKNKGKFILNIKNHIRKGEEIDVVSFHIESLKSLGFKVVEKVLVKTPSLKYGANGNKRVEGEWVILFEKTTL